MTIELCCECYEPTGNAGIHDGSIYDTLGNGPFCDTCAPGETCRGCGSEDVDLETCPVCRENFCAACESGHGCDHEEYA